jgi:ketosteroid isomerase-like protein
MPQDKVELAKRAVDAFNRRDVDAFFAELATPDFEWWPALTRGYEGGCFRGRQGVESFYADTSENWEEFHSVAEEFRDLGDCVLVLSRLEGRGRGSGAPVHAPIWNILDFRDGRFWRTRAYFDRAEALRAAGVSE